MRLDLSRTILRGGLAVGLLTLPLSLAPLGSQAAVPRCRDLGYRTATPALVDPQTPSRVRPVGASPARSRLVFSDEFNGTAMDTHKWTARNWARGGMVSPDTWSYSPANVLEHDGSMELSIANPSANTYTGAEIDTAGKFTHTYGTLEARVLLPPTQGHLGAVWLNTNAIHNVDGTARDGAELDVIESNYQADKYSVTVHWDGYGADHQQSAATAPAPGLHSGWHVFGLSWSPTRLDFTYDGTVVRTITDPVLISQVPEYALLSHELLDGWADGSIHDETFGPRASMYVDYIRVWH